MPTVGAGRDEAVSDVGENSYICRVMADYVNIHTHRPTGRCTELRTAGIHPWEAARELAAVRSEGLAGRLGEALAGAQALGETGLDFACSTDREAQTELLRAHLRLARERGLAVVLHCVRAFEPLMNELKACPPPGGHLPRLHRLARAGAAGRRQRLVPLLRHAYFRFAAEPRSAAHDAARTALLRDGRRPCGDRKRLRRSRRSAWLPRQRTATGDGG